MAIRSKAITLQSAPLLTDTSRNIFILSGRVTDGIAFLLSIHLHKIRSRIYHLPSNAELWPECVLRMRKQDVVILFDVRRYQPNLAEASARPIRASSFAVTDK